MARRPADILDLLQIRFPHDAAVSPDGKHVVFALGRLDYHANEIRGTLWIVPTRGGEPRPFTTGEARDAKPVWSPDGRQIAFLSNRSGTRSGRRHPAMQLWVIPADGGEARQLTFLRAGVSQPAWSPDGRSLAFVSRGAPEEREEDREREEPVVREITRAKYRFDAMGYYDGYAHLWRIDLDGGALDRLTDGDFDHDSPAWSPRSGEIYFLANRTPQADFAFERDVWAIDERTRALRQITRNRGPCVAQVPSPDGRWIATISHDFRAQTATNFGIWIVPAQGGEAVNLTAGFDRSVGNAVGTDVRLAPRFPTAVWAADGESVIFFATDAGHTHLYQARPDGTVTPLTSGAEVVDGVAAGGGSVVYQRVAPASFDELWTVEPGGDPRRLTEFNEALAKELEMAEPERFTYAGVDGWPMEGWVLTPPGFDSARRYPAILRIHGGPHAAYGDVFSHYTALLAARGYVLVWTNPRGSGGYGEAFTQAVVGDWGGKDSEDILLGLDHIMSRGFIDSDRVAVTGGSYGGFMTNWLITHTPRFRCAVTEVCVANLHSFYGTSDIGATWGEVEWGGNPWDDAERLLRHSPLAYVRNVTTPVLITANEADYRCPVEQSEQFFMALRKLGKEAVFLRFRGESHTMGSDGRPQPRLERLRRLVEWFDRYLRPGEIAAAPPALVASPGPP